MDTEQKIKNDTTAKMWVYNHFPKFDDMIYDVIEMMYDKGMTKEDILKHYGKEEPPKQDEKDEIEDK